MALQLGRLGRTFPDPQEDGATAAQGEAQNSTTSTDYRRAADRKRRMTAPETPPRRYGHAPPQTGSSSGQSQGPVGLVAASTTNAGSSADNPIDLMSSPLQISNLPSRPQPAPRQRGHPHPFVRRPTMPHPLPQPSVGGSDIVLPSWQPDAAVSSCPVCKTAFSFWYRKHHCRKCGRVVCAHCSPHRITIPSQFIVRPPSVIDLTDDHEEMPAFRNHWGGEEVRVCNPCVPDPNMSPPPQRPSDRIPSHNCRLPTATTEDGAGIPSILGRPRNSTGPLVPPPPLLAPYRGHRSTSSDISHLYPGHIRPTARDAFRYPPGSFPNQPGLSGHWPPSTPPPHPAGPSSGMYPPRNSSSNAQQFAQHYRSLITPQEPPRAPPPPRRQIAEEDECPICGSELPPKGPDGSDVDREAHIDDCIRSHSYGSTTSRASPDADRTGSPGLSTSSGVLAGSPHGQASAGGSPRPGGLRPRRMTGGRMLLYRATEKDCVGENGENQECIICFEEFEEGDEMGRLECLCKFHKSCIRQWWDTKGMGSCPTHQLHD
ncbi:hypothetical protein EJ06DRAFT_193883 [Trichodelitschia bisporula]|uniref:RING-type E3 ubiquitin transferase n=1 Tax=Trichodelitschia bisporula TaxID=703511 RepID=A0A6G1I7Z8_9PEZI|nr:hypothetical protein EJ06DRAFT_193883 [Trichodelitschia bisporula]